MWSVAVLLLPLAAAGDARVDVAGAAGDARAALVGGEVVPPAQLRHTGHQWVHAAVILTTQARTTSVTSKKIKIKQGNFFFFFFRHKWGISECPP